MCGFHDTFLKDKVESEEEKQKVKTNTVTNLQYVTPHPAQKPENDQ